MKKYLTTILTLSLFFITTSIYAGTPLYSTKVDTMLESMINSTGKFTSLKFADGTTQTTAGGSGNVSYPINLAGGTETTGILPITQGGHGSNTAAGARTNLELGSNNYVLHKGFSIGSSTTPSLIGQLILGGSAGIYTDSGKIITPTELEYSDGATSNIQNQLNAKISQVGGTCTGLVADNIAIGGTNSTGTFKDVTVTGTLESGSQHSTTGTWSVATGINQDQTHYVSGSGTVEIVSSVSGATTTVNLIYVPQVWAVGSSSVTGTTEGTLSTITLPAGNKMGRYGFIEIYPLFTIATTTVTNKTFKLYISDGVGTETLINVTANYSMFEPVRFLRNQGSTSVNVTTAVSQVSAFTNAATSLPQDLTLNTNNTLTLSFTAKQATSTTEPITLNHALIRTTYVP